MRVPLFMAYPTPNADSIPFPHLVENLDIFPSIIIITGKITDDSR